MPKLFTRLAALLLGICLAADPLTAQAFASQLHPSTLSQIVNDGQARTRFSEEAIPAALADFYQTFAGAVTSRVDRWVAAWRDREPPKSVWYGRLFSRAMGWEDGTAKRIVTLAVGAAIAPALDRIYFPTHRQYLAAHQWVHVEGQSEAVPLMELEGASDFEAASAQWYEGSRWNHFWQHALHGYRVWSGQQPGMAYGVPTAHAGGGSTLHAESITIQKARGVYLWDSSGKRYLDLFSQTWSLPLGHNHRAIIRAVKRQLDRLTHLRTAYTTPEKEALAHQIVALAPAGLTQVNYALHGSVAVEGAMKLAINHFDDRDRILYLEDGFHGRSLAAMGVSWKIPDSKYRGYFGNGIEAKKDLADIEEKMIRERPAAIILELVQGNAGFKILGKDLVQGIRRLCDQHGVVMIVDEVQTAFGPSGRMFLSDDYGIVPDILVFGKSIGGGFPLAGILYKDSFTFQPGDHSFTFGQNPVSFAAGLAYLEELQPVLGRVKDVNRQMEKALRRLEGRFSHLRDARTIGLKGAIDVVDDEGRPDGKTAALIVSKMQERGVIIAASRYRDLGNALMLQPPIIISRDQLKGGFDVLEGVLNEVYPIRLDAGFPAGVLRASVRDNFSRLGRLKRPDGRPVRRYRYDPKNEVAVLHEGVWYQFSFVPERAGEYDRPIPIDQVAALETAHAAGLHRAPRGRACPFCAPPPEEVLFFLRMPSGRDYAMVQHIEPYGVDHMIFAWESPVGQLLDATGAVDLLWAAKALGPGYEGSFTSSSGASVSHYHGQFYRKKTPLWKNLVEGRIPIIHIKNVGEVSIGELSGWSAKIVEGTDAREVGKAAQTEINSLLSQGIPYNSKFVYTATGLYQWVIAPRIMGFMDYAGYFLEPEDAPRPQGLSGAGSIESPGLDAVMFFDKPERFTEFQKQLMASRFKQAVRETSNPVWITPESPSSGATDHHPLWKDGKLNLPKPVQIAHRIESLDQAKEALRKGAQVLEADVQVTSDHVPVVFWGVLGPTPGDSRQYAYELTFAELEARLGKRILKLADLFELAKGNAALDLDVKDWADALPGHREAVLGGLINLIRRYEMADDVLVESFNWAYIEDLRSLARTHSLDVRSGIAIPSREKDIDLVVQKHVGQAKELGVQSLFLYPQQLTQAIIETIHREGLLVVTNLEGLDPRLADQVDLVAGDDHQPDAKNILNMSAEEVLEGVTPDITDHSIRHAKIAVTLARALNLTEEQVKMLERAAWAHDIGGFDKAAHPDEHKKLLRLEFAQSAVLGVKPSFNPQVCIEHAQERIAHGLRGPLTAEEIRDPYPLYRQEFELLNGGPLTPTEELVLRSWWYHALYSVHVLQNRHISLPPEIEALIRCNEQPWLMDTDPKMLELRKKFTLQPHEFKRLLAIMRASDILENGANKDRRDLRGVPVEDLPTTIRFMEYKFRIDGFQDVMDVVEAVKRVFHDRDGGKVAAQRPSDPGIPAFDAIVEEARHFRILEGLIDLMHPDMVTGARAFLSRLMQKPAQGKPVPLFIASGALNPILQSYLRVCGLEESAFREIAGSPQAKHVAIGHALEATRGDPGVVVMVGDARKDREEAEHPDLPKNDIAFIARLDGSGEDMGATLGAPDFNGMDWDPESRTLTFTNAFTGRTIALVVRAFVFDADGTLFDTQPLADEAIRRHGADMLGIPLGHPDYESLRTIGERLARETRGFSDQEIMRLIYDEILAYYARQKEAERPHDFAARSGYRWAAGTEISTALGLAGIIYGMDLHSLGGWFALMTVGLYGTLAALSFYLIAKVTHELMGSTKDPIAASDNPDGTRGSRADPFRALEYYAGQSRFYRWVTDSIEYHESFQNHILGMLAMLPGVHFMIDNARNQAEALDMAA